MSEAKQKNSKSRAKRGCTRSNCNCTMHLPHTLERVQLVGVRLAACVEVAIVGTLNCIPTTEVLASIFAAFVKL